MTDLWKIYFMFDFWSNPKHDPDLRELGSLRNVVVAFSPPRVYTKTQNIRFKVRLGEHVYRNTFLLTTWALRRNSTAYDSLCLFDTENLHAFSCWKKKIVCDSEESRIFEEFFSFESIWYLLRRWESRKSQVSVSWFWFENRPENASVYKYPPTRGAKAQQT